MAHTLMGKKRGMVRVFKEDGTPAACTLIAVEPNIVTQLKKKATDGYEAIQIGFEEIKTNDPRTVEKRVTKPLLGHFKKANVAPRRHLKEVRVEDSSKYEIGQQLSVELFEGVKTLDVTGITKGKGYQGVIKKYHFSGGPAAHGSGFHRHAGSTGMRTTPGRCLPGGPRPSHMGAVQRTAQGLSIISIDKENGVILVEGAVPGPINGLVILTKAKK